MAKIIGTYQYHNIPTTGFVPQESEEEKLKRLGSYFNSLRQNAGNLQSTADYAGRMAADRTKLIESIDDPSPQDVEQAHPAQALLNYLPTNPLFMQNIANATKSWFGEKPEHPVWNANYGDMFLDSKIQKLNEVEQYQNIASTKLEKRTPEQMDQLNQYVQNELKKGNYKTAKTILQSMPENYDKLSPDKKVEVLSNSTDAEQQYLSWKTKQTEKIKKGEDERKKKQNFATNASEAVQGNDWFSNMKRDVLGSVGNIIQSTIEPIKQSVENTNKIVDAPRPTSVGEAASNMTKIVGGLFDMAFSVGMGATGFNEVIGAAKGSMVENQFNLINNAAMQILNLPGTAAVEVSKKLGVTDPELLQAISSVTNGAALMALPAFKQKYTSELTKGVGEMIKEGKLRKDNSLAEDARLAISGKENVEVPNKEAMPVGEQVVKDAISQKNIAEGTPSNPNELQQAYEIAKRKSEVFTSSPALSKPEEYAKLQEEWKASGKTKADFARELMAKEDELAKQVESMPKPEVVQEGQVKPAEEQKPVKEEVAEEVGALDEDVPPMPEQAKSRPKAKKIDEPPPEDMSNPYDDYEPTPQEKTKMRGKGDQTTQVEKIVKKNNTSEYDIDYKEIDKQDYNTLVDRFDNNEKEISELKERIDYFSSREEKGSLEEGYDIYIKLKELKQLKEENKYISEKLKSAKDISIKPEDLKKEEVDEVSPDEIDQQETERLLTDSINEATIPDWQKDIVKKHFGINKETNQWVEMFPEDEIQKFADPEFWKRESFNEEPNAIGGYVDEMLREAFSRKHNNDTEYSEYIDGFLEERKKKYKENRNYTEDPAIQNIVSIAQDISVSFADKLKEKTLRYEAKYNLADIPEVTVIEKPVRVPKEIPLEIKNTKEISEGHKFFDKEGSIWETVKTTPDGGIIAKDGYDNLGNQKVQKFSGDIEIRGLNSKETAYQGGLAMDEATQKSIDILNELEGKAPENIEPMDKRTAEIHKNNLEAFKKNPLHVRFMQKLSNKRNYASKKFPLLDYNDPKQAFTSNWLRVYESIKDHAFKQADGALFYIQKPLKKVKGGIEAFSMRAYYKTIKNDFDNGLYTNKETGEILPLPDKLDINFINSEVAKYEKMFSENEYLKAADAIYKLHWDNILFKAVENGTAPKKWLKNRDAYFHKQILDYFPREDILNGDLWRDQSNMNKSRTGSDKSFSTNWFVSQGMVMNHLARKTLEMESFMKNIKEVDRRLELIAKAKAEGKDQIDIPTDHVKFIVDEKSTFRGNANLAEDLMNHILGVDDTKIGGKEFIVHKNIAKVLNEAIYHDKDELNRSFRALDKTWKVNTLFNPFRFAKYELRNAFSDNSAIFGTYPKIFNYMKGAWKQVAEFDHNKVMSKRYNQFSERAGFGSTMNQKEFLDAMNSISNRDLEQMFNPLKPKSWNLPKKYLKNVVELNAFREKFTRLAAFEYFADRLEANPNAKIYGSSNRKVIDSLKDPLDKAAMLARDLMIDYGNSTAMANRFGRGVAPFYRWIEGNPKRIINQIRNIPFEDGNILKNAGKIGIRTAPILGAKFIKYGLMSQAAYGLVQLYNRTMFPEASQKLTASQVRSGDMIIDTDDDGNVITLPLQSYFNDFLSWGGAGDYFNDAIDIIAGRKSLNETGKEMYRSIPNKIAQSLLPIPKIFGEYVTGKSYYNVLEPTPITDRKLYLARAAQIEPIYRMVMKMAGTSLPEKEAEVPFVGVKIPDKTLGFLYNTVAGAVFNKTNLDELAYNIIRSKTFRYKQEVKGKEAPSSVPDDATEARNYYRMAIKYGDKQAKKEWEAEYKKIQKAAGWSDARINQGLRSAIQNVEPLHAIAKKDRYDFEFNYLTTYEREVLKTAREYYRKTFVETDNK